MPNPLIPELAANRLTVDAALKSPTRIRDRIAKLVDRQLLLPRFFHPYGARVEGGGLLFASLTAADFYTAGPVEQRTAGAEYRRVEPLDPEFKLAAVEDWGAAAELPDEAVIRSDIDRLDATVTQLSNDVQRKIDQRTVDALEASAVGSVAVATSWDELILVGPADQITPSGDRPTAHVAQAQELADIDEMGVELNALVVGPAGARALRTAYAENLDAMLKSAGLKMFSNPRVPSGTAYIVEEGQAGVVGFESPLTVEVIPQPLIRARVIQVYVVPALAVTRPYAVKKLVGIV